MNRRVCILAVISLVMAMEPYRAHAQGPPPRLIADNRTPYAVEVLAWNGNSWNFVRRVTPGTWTPFPNAPNGSLWRAVIGQIVRDHQVRYVYDSSYGGYQDVWWIQ
jgi:hypothetical protein